jgi:hypothetical protein
VNHLGPNQVICLKSLRDVGPYPTSGWKLGGYGNYKTQRVLNSLWVRGMISRRAREEDSQGCWEYYLATSLTEQNAPAPEPVALHTVTMTVRTSEVEEGDEVIALDEFPLEPSIAVVSVSERYTTLEPTKSGLERRLWFDQQHTVTVRRDIPGEIILPEDAYEIISDALLMIKEDLQGKGLPHERTIAIMKLLHTFTTPTIGTEIIVRPRA